MNVGAMVILSVLAATWMSIQVVILARLRGMGQHGLLVWRTAVRGLGLCLILVGFILLLAMKSHVSHVVVRTMVWAGVIGLLLGHVMMWIWWLYVRLARSKE